MLLFDPRKKRGKGMRPKGDGNQEPLSCRRRGGKEKEKTSCDKKKDTSNNR